MFLLLPVLYKQVKKNAFKSTRQCSLLEAVRVCARTRLSETAHSHKFTAHKHNHDEAMLSVGKFGEIVFGLAETGLLNQECGVDERKIGHLRT